MAWDLFYLHGLTLIPAWIINHIHYKAWDEITYPLLNFKVISSNIVLGMDLLTHAWIKV